MSNVLKKITKNIEDAKSYNIYNNDVFCLLFI